MELSDIAEKLDELIAMVKAGMGGVGGNTRIEPWMTPALPESQVVADGLTVNADGSTWVTTTSGDFSPFAPASAAPSTPMKIKVIYGYISREKDPVLWGKMVACFDGGEARLQELLDTNGKLARYRTDPNAFMHLDAPSAFMLLSQLLGSATPPTPPTHWV